MLTKYVWKSLNWIESISDLRYLLFVDARFSPLNVQFFIDYFDFTTSCLQLQTVNCRFKRQAAFTAIVSIMFN